MESARESKIAIGSERRGNMLPKSEAQSSSLKVERRKLPEMEIQLQEIYRELNIFPGDYLQGADIIRFMEFLIAATQVKKIRWKIINERAVELKLVFPIEMIEPYRARRKRKIKWKWKGKKLEDAWEMTLEKISKKEKNHPLAFWPGETYFRFSLTNKFNRYPEDIGTWEVPIWDKEKDLLSMRIEAFWEVVYSSSFIGRMLLKKFA
jgi:hypothetical protein